MLKDADVVIPLAGMVDIEAEKARLSKEMEILEREITRLSGAPGGQPVHIQGASRGDRKGKRPR